MTGLNLDTLLRDLPSSGAGIPGRCLDDDDTARLVDGLLPGPELEPVLRHLQHCPDCHYRVRALMSLADQPAVEVPSTLIAAATEIGQQGKVASATWTRQWHVALAASVSVILIGGLLWAQIGTAPGPATAYTTGRIEGDVGTVRASVPSSHPLQMTSPGDGDRVDPSTLVLEWSPVAECLYYEVELLTRAGDIVWKFRTETVRADFPATVDVQANQNYFVWVRARLRDGKSVQSPALRLQFTPRE